MLYSSTYTDGSWSSDLPLGNFSTAVKSRSLSIASTMYDSLLYYEDPNGRVSVLSQQDVQHGYDDTIYGWIDATSQESKSLPDEFRNTPASIAKGYSKTLYESLGTNTTLRAPFACGANWTEYPVGAIFYSPELSSPNASKVQFTLASYASVYVEDEIGNQPGNFPMRSTAPHSTKPRIAHNFLQAELYYR